MAERKGKKGLLFSYKAIELLGENNKRGSICVRFYFVYRTCFINLGRLKKALQVFKEMHNL
jgi:hypothetical protein